MHQQHTTTSDDLRPLAGTDAASAPPCSGFTLRGRDWIYSAATMTGPTTPTARTGAADRGLIG